MGQMHVVGPDLENPMHAPRSFQHTGVYKASRIPRHSPPVSWFDVLDWG